MLNGYIAVEPAHDEGYEQVSVPEVTVYGNRTGQDRIMRVKQSGSGIIYDIDEKPIFRHGILRHRGIPNDGQEYNVGAGDKIIYTDFSEFKNTIEGKEYYIMKLWDILGVYKRVTVKEHTQTELVAELLAIGGAGHISGDLGDPLEHFQHDVADEPLAHDNVDTASWYVEPLDVPDKLDDSQRTQPSMGLDNRRRTYRREVVSLAA